MCASSSQSRVGRRPLSPTMAYHHANRSSASRDASLAGLAVLAVDGSRTLKLDVGVVGVVVMVLVVLVGVQLKALPGFPQVCFEAACHSWPPAPASPPLVLSAQARTPPEIEALHPQKPRSCFAALYLRTGST